MNLNMRWVNTVCPFLNRLGRQLPFVSITRFCIALFLMLSIRIRAESIEIFTYNGQWAEAKQTIWPKGPQLAGFTVEGWVLPTYYTLPMVVASDTAYDLSLLPGSYAGTVGVRFRLWNSNGNSVGIEYYGTPRVFCGVWTHVAATFDADSKQINIFVNGAIAYNGHVDISYFYSKSTEKFKIGPFNQKTLSPSGPPKDMADEIRISRGVRYLTAFAPQSRFTIDADTMALYHFDANLLDSSLFQNHLQFVKSDSSGALNTSSRKGDDWNRNTCGVYSFVGFPATANMGVPIPFTVIAERTTGGALSVNSQLSLSAFIIDRNNSFAEPITQGVSMQSSLALIGSRCSGTATFMNSYSNVVVIAQDSLGVSALSIAFMVAPNLEEIRFTPPARLTLDGFQMVLSGRAGIDLAIQSSLDLVNWTDWKTLSNPTGTLNITDMRTNSDQRYYRALSLTPP